jgi:putative Ig domain-containing protein
MKTLVFILLVLAASSYAQYVSGPNVALGTVGSPMTIQTNGLGTQPITYTGTNLPPGLTLDQSTGKISGTPTTRFKEGTTVSAIDASGTVLAPLTITIMIWPVADCNYTLTRTPVGAFLVFQNGGLITDTMYTKIGPKTYTPNFWADGDWMQFVFSRAVPLTATVNGQTVNYWSYQMWNEGRHCNGNNPGIPGQATTDQSFAKKPGSK